MFPSSLPCVLPFLCIPCCSLSPVRFSLPPSMLRLPVSTSPCSFHAHVFLTHTPRSFLAHCLSSSLSPSVVLYSTLILLSHCCFYSYLHPPCCSHHPCPPSPMPVACAPHPALLFASIPPRCLPLPKPSILLPHTQALSVALSPVPSVLLPHHT